MIIKTHRAGCRAICCFEIMALVALPVLHYQVAWADDMSDATKSGQDSGRLLQQQSQRWFDQDLGQFDPEAWQPQGAEDDLATYDLSDENAIRSASSELKHQLYHQEATATSSPYGIMLDSRLNHSPGSLSSDPSLHLQALAIFDEAGGDLCSQELVTLSSSSTYHISDLRHCTQVVSRSGQCDLTHQLWAEPVIGLLSSGVAGYDNSINIIPCKGEDNCLLLFVGQEYHDNAGACLKYEDALKIVVYHPQAITKVVLSQVGWDDFWGSWITDHKGVRHPLLLPTYELPVYLTDPADTASIEAQGWIKKQGWVIVDRLANDRVVNNIDCENTWHGGNNCQGGGRCRNWDLNRDFTADGYDLTAIFKQADAQHPLLLESLTSTADDGNYRLQLKVYYDPAKTVLQDVWSPQECLQLAGVLQDQSGAGVVECVEYLPAVVTDPDPILLSNGQIIELKYLATPVASVPAHCARARVSVTDFYASYAKDDCDRFASCGFISSKCSDEGISGNCYAYDQVYDCGIDVHSTDESVVKAYNCDGEIRCLGTQCIQASGQVSTGFAKVSALLQTADFMAQDLNCTGLDDKGHPTGKEDVICRFFAGKARSCTRSLRGMGAMEVDCCDCPPGISLAQYLSALLMISKLDSTIAGMDHASSIYGAYSALRRPVFNTVAGIKNQLSTVTQPFTSWFENTTGMRGLFSSDQSIVEYVTDKLKAKARELLQKIIAQGQDKLAAQGVTQAGSASGASSYTSEQSANAIVESASSALAVVGYVYMIYQISSLVSAMLFKCDQEALELSAQRSLKNCTPVGHYCAKKIAGHCISRTYSYCCFSSPLSRIIQEQIHLQQGNAFRDMDPKHPDCGGLGVDELSAVDWSKINLEEWTALLKSTGNYEPQKLINPDTLTGSGSALNLDYADSQISDRERHNVVDRTIDRVFDLDFDQIRNDVDANYLIDAGQ